MKKSENIGHTLVELLVVLGVLLIMIGTFLPIYITFQEKTRVKSAISNLVMMKKALNDLSTTCRGFPISLTQATCQPPAQGITGAFLQRIVDKDSCKGSPDISQVYIWPSCKPCEGTGLGDMVGLASKKSTTVAKNGLCEPACENNNSCFSYHNYNSNKVFLQVPGDPCSPTLPNTGSAVGWNYKLLVDAALPMDHPVGVLCGFTSRRGNKTVRIVINTAGFYAGVKVKEGGAIFNIDGSFLPNGGCSCGPYCEDSLSGQSGCCSPCEGLPGIGYKY